MKIHTLKNGFRYIFIEQPVESILGLVLVKVGSRDEQYNYNGISHVLEHMCFKGTKTYDDTYKFKLLIDNNGLETNAFTHYLYTGYWIKGNPNDAKLIIDILSSMLIEPTFPEDELKKEKQVIIKELDMRKDNVFIDTYDFLTENLYGDDQSMGRPIGGSVANVLKITRDDLVKFHNMYYHGNNSLLVLCGNIKNKKMLENRIKKNFSKLPTGPQNKLLSIMDKDRQKDINLSLLKRPSARDNLVLLAYRTFGHNDVDSWKTDLICELLTSGMSSVLFKLLREDHPLIYYVKSENNVFPDHGFLLIRYGTSIENVEKSIILTINELEKISKNGISNNIFEKIKKKWINSALFALEDPSNVCDYYGTQCLLYNNVDNIKSTIKEINNYSIKDFNKLLKDVFVNKYLNIIVNGNYIPKKDFINKLKLKKETPKIEQPKKLKTTRMDLKKKTN